VMRSRTVIKSLESFSFLVNMSDMFILPSM